MARVEKTIFISYRRTDVYTALAVYQSLSSKGYDVFFDYTSIPSGDFEQIILSNIKGRAHFLLILTPTALDRCDEPGDWLRREIETAIDEKRNIIPLFFKNFKFGTPSVAEKLTGKLASLNRYNGMNVHEDYFPAAMDRLGEQFLDVPLETVLHPVSTEVRKVVRDEQIAADKALEGKDLVNIPADKIMEKVQATGKKLNLKMYGIGAGVLVAVALAIAGINAMIKNTNQAKAPTTTPEQVVEQVSPTDTPASVPTDEPVAAPAVELVAGSTMVSPKDGMTLLYIPAGEFEMGSDLGEYDEVPIHSVYLDAYWIDQTEVTNSMYVDCVDAGVCSRPNNTYYSDPSYADYPIQDVAWEDANDYCSWIDRRLPTEAEWEKAAGWNDRTKEKYIYPWGNEFDGSLINWCDVNCTAFEWADTEYDDGYAEESPVGSYPLGASPYGALDMAGNVWEWVADWYSDNYYANSPLSNPTGPASGDDHILRGGSWASGYNVLTTSFRDREYPLINFGFRCAMNAE